MSIFWGHSSQFNAQKTDMQQWDKKALVIEYEFSFRVLSWHGGGSTNELVTMQQAFTAMFSTVWSLNSMSVMIAALCMLWHYSPCCARLFFHYSLHNNSLVLPPPCLVNSPFNPIQKELYTCTLFNLLYDVASMLACKFQMHNRFAQKCELTSHTKYDGTKYRGQYVFRTVSHQWRLGVPCRKAQTVFLSSPTPWFNHKREESPWE